MVGHSPVLQILLQIAVRMSIMASPSAWTNFAGMLSMPADFPIFSALTADSTTPSGSPLFFFRSRLWSLRSNPRLPLPALLAKKFSCCVSYCLAEVGDHGVQISIFIYQHSKRCKSITYSCLENTHYCWIIQLLEVKPDSWLGWFP